jgi:hypothetical protein
VKAAARAGLPGTAQAGACGHVVGRAQSPGCRDAAGSTRRRWIPGRSVEQRSRRRIPAARAHLPGAPLGRRGRTDSVASRRRPHARFRARRQGGASCRHGSRHDGRRRRRAYH